MPQISSIKGHFDGSSVVLDEPASLVVGQAVRVIVEPVATEKIEAVFSPFPNMIAALMNDDSWDEKDALHIDPIEAVPSDFVRKPGSGAGEIKMADNFGTTPEDFKEYL